MKAIIEFKENCPLHKEAEKAVKKYMAYTGYTKAQAIIDLILIGQGCLNPDLENIMKYKQKGFERSEKQKEAQQQIEQMVSEFDQMPNAFDRC